MKMVKEILLSVLMFICLFSCNGQQKVNDPLYDSLLTQLLSHDVQEVSVSQLTKQEHVIYLDAREWTEYNVSHIAGAIWVGYDDFSFKRLKGISKETEIIVYCSVGYRSEKITEKLVERGYTHVSNLYGGIFEWVNQGNSVVDTDNKLTLKVHAYDKSWGVWLKKGVKIY